MIELSIKAKAATRRNVRPPLELIYCSGGNRRFAEIAINTGFSYGAQLPETIYFPIRFADQNWKTPNKDKYIKALKKHRPRMATVLDLERPDQLQEVLEWAEEAAIFVDTILLIPKYSGAIASLPRVIGGSDIRLAYSVPTKYAGTEVPLWEFYDWPVHLLGGSPHKQMEIAKYLNVASVDGNMAQKVAIRWCSFWQPGTARWAKDRWWPRLDELGSKIINDAPYIAFQKSCTAIMEAWRTNYDVS